MVYGIAITAMSFFTDPTISTLTSGAPSQNVDLGGLSFPRGLGVRFESDFIRTYKLAGKQARWQAYSDIDFKHSLGNEFYHEDLVTREGWARYYFKGKFPQDEAFVKLELVNVTTGMIIREFFFKFKKNYQTNLDARYFMTDPILEEKIVKNGILTEFKPYMKEDSSEIVYRKGHMTFGKYRIADIHEKNPKKDKIETNAIMRTWVRYTEKPKMVFLVTPPHMMPVITSCIRAKFVL